MVCLWFTLYHVTKLEHGVHLSQSVKAHVYSVIHVYCQLFMYIACEFTYFHRLK